MAGASRSDAIGDAREGRNRLTDLVRERMDDTGNGLTRSQIDHNAARLSPLEKLVADAGPLGKFMVDRDDALPAGTSAFTVRSADTAIRVASRTGIVTEPVLAGNPLIAPPALERANAASAPQPHAIHAIAAVSAAQSADPVARLAITALPLGLDTGNRLGQPLRDSVAIETAKPPTPRPSAEPQRPASDKVAPQPAPARPDPAAVLASQGLVDLLAAGMPIASPHDAPPGAVLVYQALGGGPGALELRVANGFAREGVSADPLTGAALEGNGYRLSAVYAGEATQPRAANTR